ncbi:Sensor domain-containing diguanylate cyclase [Pseudomonas sp. 8Z]|uniref:sensor domain-containing diguanylate cyclase n=1 Tax=Pseudomonas sp. 8Z TaxID=2653166 RepID=UPI0012F17E90|nr:diguanylate cyclase [Pseudomonas sp. 8Z]VXD00497.1 Sensor domain-containing diguanylate cyclase [Pseudomonas sp. 8Z]
MNIALHLRFAWLLLGLLLPLSIYADSRVVDVSSTAQSPLSLTSHVGVVEDATQALTLEAIDAPEMAEHFDYEQSPSASFALGFTRSAYWFRLVLGNSADQPLKRLLEVDNPRISLVDAYVADGQGGYRRWLTGADRPMSGKAYDNRNFVFPIELPARSQRVVYLRVQSNIALLVPLRLWSVEGFHAHERADYMARSSYMGIAVAMILFNLMLFIALGDRIYLLYVVFASCVVCSLAIKVGMAPDWLLFGVSLQSNVAYYVSASWALSALVLFMRRMLQTDRLLPAADRLLQGMFLFYLISPCLYLVALPQVARFAIFFFLFAPIAIFAVGLACALKRQRSAYFFLAAFGLLMLGGASTTLRAMGLLPTNAFTEDGLLLGSSLEMLLLAFALADRINVMRKQQLQTKTQLLQAQEQLVENLQHSERELEQRVTQRTEELQVLNQRLETLSMTDALTGIANRRMFDEALQRQWLHAQRCSAPLTLAVMDVDWFKPYNDLYGHPAGDACLRQIAQALQAAVSRSTDTVARYGGEEFVLLAPMTDLAGGYLMAEKLAEVVAALNLRHEGSPLDRVTLSIGVASTVVTPGMQPQALIQQADSALYRAKLAGRNCIECDPAM